MIYGSVCSGIEAATVAWHPLGWRCAFASEIEPFPRAVLQHRWPEIPLHGDFTTIQAGDYDPIGLLVGGTPCQSFSVAGLRGGLEDDRGNLALEYLRLADRLRPRWLVWENVPGVLSSSGGRDFGAILGGMVELGYGFAYRVLDAQFFRVAQRRRRVFVVGYLGDWRRAAAVLFERHCLQGNPPPIREARQGIAGTLAGGARRGGGYSEDDIPHVAFGGNNCSGPVEVAAALQAHAGPAGRMDFASETFVAQPYTIMERGRNGAPNLEYRQDGTANAILTPNGGRGGLGVGAICFSAKDHGGDAIEDLSPTLRAGGHSGSHANAGVMPAVAFAHQGGGTQTRLGYDPDAGTAQTLSANQTPAIAGPAVRRLTPVECERLQGFPDDYTLIPWRKGVAPDGPRYKALGNSMAVPVMAWLGQRIEDIDAYPLPREAA